MGKSSSSSSSTTTTEQRDERVATGDGSVVIQVEEGGQFELIDPGSVEVIDEGLDVVERALTMAMSSAEKAQGQASEVIEKILAADKTEAAQGVDGLIKAGVIVAGIGAAVYVLPKIMKKR